MRKKILLIEPDFPIPPKSKNHKDFLPIGLLKIGAMFLDNGNSVKLLRGNKSEQEIIERGNSEWLIPDEIFITSLFTYWKPFVVQCVDHYKNLYKDVINPPIIKVGGIYASLMPDDCVKIDGVDKCHKGLYPEAESYNPAYELLKDNSTSLNFQIIHASRGCPRKCKFCGVWRIEPKFKTLKSIKGKLTKGKKGVVFYDNNLLMNPHIDNILDELIDLKKDRQISWSESQSGFDGRLLLENPHLAHKIKKAGFRYPRIAWDWKYEDKNNIKQQIDILHEAGYQYKQIFIFIIYNWDIPYEEVEKKRIECFEWNVQISDCRYRPLNQTFDYYNPMRYKNGQISDEYHIHKKAGWTDKKIRQFRKNVRRQNICIRHGFEFYSKDLERMRYSKQRTKKIINQASKINNKEEKVKFLKNKKIHFWFPNNIV